MYSTQWKEKKTKKGIKNVMMSSLESSWLVSRLLLAVQSQNYPFPARAIRAKISTYAENYSI